MDEGGHGLVKTVEGKRVSKRRGKDGVKGD